MDLGRSSVRRNASNTCAGGEVEVHRETRGARKASRSSTFVMATGRSAPCEGRFRCWSRGLSPPSTPSRPANAGPVAPPCQYEPGFPKKLCHGASHPPRTDSNAGRAARPLTMAGSAWATCLSLQLPWWRARVPRARALRHENGASSSPHQRNARNTTQSVQHLPAMAGLKRRSKT